MNPVNATFRPPFYGVVAPNGTVALHATPPIDPTIERPFYVASRPNDVTFQIAQPDTIVVSNNSSVPIAFGVLILPTNVVGPSDTLVAFVKAKIQAAVAKIRGLTA